MPDEQKAGGKQLQDKFIYYELYQMTITGANNAIFWTNVFESGKQ